jgi:hypothetical protein
MTAESTTLVESIPALAAVLALAALIAAWAEAHFNEGQSLGEIRYSVPQQRYFAALAVHVTTILGLYVLFLVTVYGAITLASSGVPQFECRGFDLSHPCVKRSLKEIPALDSDALLWSALASALFLRLVMPNVAMTWRFLDRLRKQTHELALFPFARQTLLAALSASKFAAGEDSDAELRKQLDRYGVDWKLMSFVSPSAKRSLVEVCSLRQRLTDLLKPLQCFAQVLRPQKPRLDSRLLAGSLRPTDEIEFSSSQSLRKFGAARAVAFGELETDFRRVMRRTALALLLAQEISEKIESEPLYRAISNFVAEECDDVLARYRSLVAEAALSCVPHRAERVQFLKSFGYDAPVPPALPLYPWIVVFLLDFLLFMIPSLVMLNLSGQDPNLRIAPLAMFGIVHALSQTVALTWAIYPKMVSNLARPTPYSLPWQSYVVFGLASYATGVIILFIFRLVFPFPFPIVLPTLVSSFSFLLMTVGTSFLIDRRLQSGSLDFEEGRIGDGLILAALMASGTLTFQLVIFYLAPALGWLNPGQVPGFLPIRLLFLVLSAGLGFVMGYFVPSATAAFMQKAYLLRLAEPGGIRTDLRPGSTTTWDPRPSPQA